MGEASPSIAKDVTEVSARPFPLDFRLILLRGFGQCLCVWPGETESSVMRS